MKVYLAGTMEGITVRDATVWRNYARGYLVAEDITVYNPVLHIDPALKDDDIVQGYMSHAELFAQDIFNLRDSDIILVRLSRASTGTSVEIGIAYALQKLIIGFDVCDQLLDHPFIIGTINLLYDSLDLALEYICSLK